jgi:hypothetical protein
MEDRLALRLQMFREGGQVRPQVIDFVACELDGLAAAGQVAAELAGHPAALATARAVPDRAEATPGAALPESGINFLGMHLAARAQHSPS